MKTMTCKQLHGACDFAISDDTSQGMIAKSQAHGMEMVAKEMAEGGDQPHVRAMEAMKNYQGDPQQFMKEFEAQFAAWPEDK